MVCQIWIFGPFRFLSPSEYVCGGRHDFAQGSKPHKLRTPAALQTGGTRLEEYWSLKNLE